MKRLFEICKIRSYKCYFYFSDSSVTALHENHIFQKKIYLYHSYDHSNIPQIKSTEETRKNGGKINCFDCSKQYENNLPDHFSLANSGSNLKHVVKNINRNINSLSTIELMKNRPNMKYEHFFENVNPSFYNTTFRKGWVKYQSLREDEKSYRHHPYNVKKKYRTTQSKTNDFKRSFKDKSNHDFTNKHSHLEPNESQEILSAGIGVDTGLHPLYGSTRPQDTGALALTGRYRSEGTGAGSMYERTRSFWGVTRSLDTGSSSLSTRIRLLGTEYRSQGRSLRSLGSDAPSTLEWSVEPPPELVFSNDTGAAIHCGGRQPDGQPVVSWQHDDGRPVNEVRDSGHVVRPIKV